MGAGGAVIALVAVSWPAMAHAKGALLRASYGKEASALTRGEVRGSVIGFWSFSGGLPRDWDSFSHADLTAGAGATTVSTRPSNAEYQVWSAPRRLRPGAYAVVVAGRVERGGISVGVLDTGADKWLAQTSYWSGQSFARGRMVTRIAVGFPVTVQIILANWSPEGDASRWQIRDVRLVRSPRK